VRITTVFNKLLSLQGARVVSVAWTPTTLVVSVANRQRRHRCPHCSFSTRGGYDRHVRGWRHVALGRWRVVLQSTIYRLECPAHGVVTESVPWAEHESRFTRDFEDLVAWLAREMNKTAVTRLVRISWVTVGTIIARVVARTLDRERLSRLYRIGVDEVSYRKGHKYLTLVADHVEGGIIWAGEGRSQQALGRFFDELGPERSSRLEAASMDMCAPYVAEVRARAPNAKIAFDPFHVVKLGNEAVHDLRRREARIRKGSTAAKVLKGSRWALLKAPETLRFGEYLRLSEVAQLNAKVYRGYLLKEELRALYACSPSSAPQHLAAWLRWASRSRLAPFVKVAGTLRRYRTGVLDAVRLGLSNGRLEGLNNKIGVLKHRAYGFHSAAALIAMIYLCCSQVSVRLPI
jgi:transposase